MANTNGGTVYVGVKSDPKVLPAGVADPAEATATLKAEIQRMITPPLDVDITTVKTHGRPVLQLSVPRGEDIPYAVDGTTIYIRQEAETSIAMRDEIVALIRQVLRRQASDAEDESEVDGDGGAMRHRDGVAVPGSVEPPGTGVQIVESEERKGALYHTMKDLRNGNIVRNVTRSSARKLWRYAITEQETKSVKEDQVEWQSDDHRLGLWKSSKRAGKVRYDLVQKMPDGELHVYYGVTEDGIDGPWRVFLED
jgi:hypothetical protein